MRIVLGIAVISVLGLSAITFDRTAAGSEISCPEVRPTNGLTRVVVDASHGHHPINPQFFGFNLTWVPFQFDLWNAKNHTVRPGVVEALRGFEGAVYRFPGGGVSNRYDWRAAVGPLTGRSEQLAVEWRGPLAADFGVDEYLSFLDTVQGKPWVVANVYGGLDRERSGAYLKELNAEFAQYLAAHSYTPVLRWELGNELDREKKWYPDKYAQSAAAISQAISATQPDSKFVAFLQDYDAFSDMNASIYNRALVSNLPARVSDFALHSYYDGPPGGPPIPNRVRHICGSIADIKAARPGSAPAVWITEHARWPGGKTSDPNWNETWGKTSNLEAALGSADFLIATAQIAEVKGAFVHNLGPTTGKPWPLFHVGRDGVAHPSAVLYGLRVLRDGLLNQVVATTTFSDSKSGYAGGYDVRAVAMAAEDKRKYSLWVVNRLGAPNTIALRWGELAGLLMNARHEFLSDSTITANNALVADRIVPASRQLQVTFNSKGEATLIVPPYSVSTFVLTPADRKGTH